MTHLVANPVKMEINGLCNYSADPEEWFDYRKAKQCKRICGNCPLRKACARTALAVEATDGVWGGVDLPGEHATVEEQTIARRQLAMVVAAMDQTERSCIRFDLKQLPANCEVATTLAVPLSIIHDYYKTEARKQV
uniref:WhiB family transcriptional regulator n=1 Tax=Mycolicibacterium vinylchloridicum TaxID=2736928 RepID=UPI001F3E17D7